MLKRFSLYNLALFALLAIAALACAQVARPAYAWDVTSDKTSSFLMKLDVNGVYSQRVGAYNHATGKYFECKGGYCVEKQPPVAPPARPNLQKKSDAGPSDVDVLVGLPPVVFGEGPPALGAPLGVPMRVPMVPAAAPVLIGSEQHAIERGVDMSKISRTEKITRRGEHLGREDALNVIGSGTKPPSALTDDSNKKRISVIGGDLKERKAVLEQLAQDPLIQAEYVLAEYDGDGWQLDPGFEKGGKQILAELPDGTTVHHQRNFDVPYAVGALRKARPDYDPKKDPDLGIDSTSALLARVRGQVADINKLLKDHMLLVAIAAIGGYLFYRKQQTPTPPAPPSPAQAVWPAV